MQISNAVGVAETYKSVGVRVPSAKIPGGFWARLWVAPPTQWLEGPFCDTNFFSRGHERGSHISISSFSFI